MPDVRYDPDGAKRQWVIFILIAVIALVLLVFKMRKEIQKLRKQIQEVENWR